MRIEWTDRGLASDGTIDRMFIARVGPRETVVRITNDCLDDFGVEGSQAVAANYIEAKGNGSEGAKVIRVRTAHPLTQPICEPWTR